jgi:acyl-CoA hydrolase
MNSFFIAENVRGAFEQGIGDLHADLSVRDSPPVRKRADPLDVALISVTPPDVNGLCSLGVSRGHRQIRRRQRPLRHRPGQQPHAATHGQQFHPRQPSTCWSLRRADHRPSSPRAPTNVLRRIGRTGPPGRRRQHHRMRHRTHPQALAEFLVDKKDLGIHTEMFGDWIIELIECGAVTCRRRPSIAARSSPVSAWARSAVRLHRQQPVLRIHPHRIRQRPVCHRQHDKMVGINVGLEIDLTGQVCADSLGYRSTAASAGRWISFAAAPAAAAASPSSPCPRPPRNDTVSRIVPRLTEGAGVVTTRGDVHYVVTEYGIAYLHGKSIRERVMA